MVNSSLKSAVELAIEKLDKQDAEAGVKSRSLTNTQKEALAEARRIFEARTAECRILHEAAVSTALDPSIRIELEANYQRDLSRLASDRDRKISESLKGSAR